jgi:hypothetical protein
VAEERETRPLTHSGHGVGAILIGQPPDGSVGGDLYRFCASSPKGAADHD